MQKLNQKIAHTLKNLRQIRGWSLSVASEKTGVSKAMLGQIEREESSPTIATLWKIATGFEVSFSSFVEDQTPMDGVYRKENLENIHIEDTKIKVIPLFSYDPHLKFEIFIIELLPGCTHLSNAHQKGVIEHVITSKGEIEVLTKDVWHRIKENEGLNFKADIPHGYRNLSKTSATFHNIIHYPQNNS